MFSSSILLNAGGSLRMLTFGLALRALSLEEALCKATEAERLGLDYVWLFERPLLVYPPKAVPMLNPR
jgi:hypothetical protein